MRAAACAALVALTACLEPDDVLETGPHTRLQWRQEAEGGPWILRELDGEEELWRQGLPGEPRAVSLGEKTRFGQEVVVGFPDGTAHLVPTLVEPLWVRPHGPEAFPPHAETGPAGDLVRFPGGQVETALRFRDGQGWLLTTRVYETGCTSTQEVRVHPGFADVPPTRVCARHEAAALEVPVQALGVPVQGFADLGPGQLQTLATCSDGGTYAVLEAIGEGTLAYAHVASDGTASRVDLPGRRHLRDATCGPDGSLWVAAGSLSEHQATLDRWRPGAAVERRSWKTTFSSDEVRALAAAPDGSLTLVGVTSAGCAEPREPLTRCLSRVGDLVGAPASGRFLTRLDGLGVIVESNGLESLFPALKAWGSPYPEALRWRDGGLDLQVDNLGGNTSLWRLDGADGGTLEVVVGANDEQPGGTPWFHADVYPEHVFAVPGGFVMAGKSSVMNARHRWDHDRPAVLWMEGRQVVHDLRPEDDEGRGDVLSDATLDGTALLAVGRFEGTIFGQAPRHRGDAFWLGRFEDGTVTSLLTTDLGLASVGLLPDGRPVVGGTHRVPKGIITRTEPGREKEARAFLWFDPH